MHAEDEFRVWATAEGWVTTKRGWPDFLCRKGAALMAVEVKDGKDGLRPEQVQALRDLHAAGIPTFVWTVSSGLMPYPGPVALVSDAALGVQVDALQAQLLQVCADRDAAYAVIAEQAATLRRLRANAAPAPARSGKDRSPDDVDRRRQERQLRKAMRLAEVAEKRAASRARTAHRIANFELDGTQILLRRDTRVPT